MAQPGPEPTSVDDIDIAVLIPCYNEGIAIGGVVREFRKALPSAAIYVYDNNSDDNTAAAAAAAGAVVRTEAQQGKGHVVRRMFSDVDASVFVLVDGDGTYDAGSARSMVQTLLNERVDAVNARRISDSEKAYRFGHRFGNRLLTAIVNWLFGRRSADILSGYRAFSRRFVKSFPALSRGFEIETELTVHALSLNIPMSEVDTPYHDRTDESGSKLNTWGDGLRILWTIVVLTKDYRPFFFYGVAGGLLAVGSLLLGMPVVIEFLDTGLVPRIPTAVLAASVMVLAFMSVVTGLVLDSVARGRRETKRLHYLALTWLGRSRRGIPRD